MIQSPQTIHATRDGSSREAAVAWRYESGSWVVEITSPEFASVSARENGGLSAYRFAPEGVESVVDTFAPVDPATVTTVAEQRAKIDRLMG